MNRMLLLVFTGLSTGLLVNADDFPRLDDQTCPKSAWLPEGDGFRFEEDHNAPLIPKRTFAHDNIFHYVFHHELDVGQTLHFSGTPELKISDEFEINIITSKNVNSDNAVRPLHIKYCRGSLVYNTFSNTWGDEENTTPSPIKKGIPFTMQIHVTIDAFEISVNGTLVHTYNHRLAFNLPGFIRILGDVHLTRARVAGRQFEIPYKVLLPNGGLELGDHVNFVATVRKGEFSMNFLNINDVIVVQFTLTVGVKASDRYELQLHRNTFKQGKLYSSQRDKNFFIAENREFTLDFMILPDKSGIAVHLDGVFYQTFSHVIQAETSKEEFYSFQVTGHVDLRALQVCPHKFVKS